MKQQLQFSNGSLPRLCFGTVQERLLVGQWSQAFSFRFIFQVYQHTHTHTHTQLIGLICDPLNRIRSIKVIFRLIHRRRSEAEGGRDGGCREVQQTLMIDFHDISLIRLIWSDFHVIIFTANISAVRFYPFWPRKSGSLLLGTQIPAPDYNF